MASSFSFSLKNAGCCASAPWRSLGDTLRQHRLVYVLFTKLTQAPEVCTNCTNYRLGLISRYFAPTPMAKRGGRRCLPPCSHAHAPEVCTNCTHYRLSSHTKLIILDVMQLSSIQAHNTRLRFDTLRVWAGGFRRQFGFSNQYGFE